MTARASLDALISPTLKDVRERWWNDEFTEFLRDTLRPRPGHRILDVGCGTGTAETSIGRLHLSQLRLVGLDIRLDKVSVARQVTASHNQRVGFVVGDASRLPFRDGVFDSTYCVAVLQHIGNVDAAVAEFARVTTGGGRIVAVEPDNSARYAYSAVPAGLRAFAMATRFFAALAAVRGDGTDPAIGPRLPTMFAAHGIEPLDARLFPVSLVQIGPPPEDLWAERRSRIERELTQAPGNELRALGREYLALLEAYASEARQAGTAFVEIQNTMLFATVGQKAE